MLYLCIVIVHGFMNFSNDFTILLTLFYLIKLQPIRYYYDSIAAFFHVNLNSINLLILQSFRK